MNAPHQIEYDIKTIERDDTEINPRSWNLRSALDGSITYRLISEEPLEYFDFKERFLLKLDKKSYYGYCVYFKTTSGSLQEDIVADFLYMDSLQKRYPKRLKTYDDFCIEQTVDQLRLICINVQEKNPEIDIDQCLVSRASELIQKGVLINLLIKLVQFISQLKDAYLYDFEIQNHNLLVTEDTRSGQFDFCLINQILPILYRAEFLNHYSDIYEEDEYEFNESLIIKKIIFLLIALAIDEGVEEYKKVRKLLSLWQNQKLKIPNEQIRYELLKLAFNLTQKLEKKETLTLANVIESLQELDRSIRNGRNPSVADRSKINQNPEQQKNMKKRASQQNDKPIKGLQMMSDAESSQVDEEEEDDENSQNSDENFGCVPVNNMDHDTVHIKVVDDEMKFHQKSQHFLIETDNDVNNPTGGYQSDVMRSLHMLGGSSGVTIKTNKYQDPNNENGQSTVINVNQIRLDLPSSRGQNLNLRDLDSERERNPSVEDLEEEEDEQESLPKYLKGAQVKNILLKGSPSNHEDSKQSVRVGIVSSNYNDKRSTVKYKNFGCTYVVQHAHSDRINCLCYLINGAFISGSSDKTIKVWSTLDQKPLGILEEDDEVTLMLRLGKTSQNDVTLLYVAKQTLRYLSIKNQKAVQIFKNDREITAIVKINTTNNIIALGTQNGIIKDYDVKNKCTIRSAKLHKGSKVTSIVSQGKYLISLSESGLVVIYDYGNQQLFRELNLRMAKIDSPKSLLLLRGDRFLTLAEEQGLTVLDIETAQVVNPTMGNQGVNKLIKLTSLNDLGQQSFAGLMETGQFKVFIEGQGDEEQVKYIETVKQFKGHQGQITDLIQFTNGAFLTCGYDSNICLWEEKKNSNSCGACCTLF